MHTPIEHLTDHLKQKGIRPSYQRLKVLEYLRQTPGHPTVEDIYRALQPEIPSLSRVTIYNTLHTFIAAGLVRLVDIDEAQMRYDASVEDHGHFLCERCGMIYNFPVVIEPAAVQGLERFSISQKNVYFKGLCPNCHPLPDSRIEEVTA